MPGNTFYETILKGVIFGSFFGVAYFTVDEQQKLLNEQQKLLDVQQKLLDEQQKLLGENLSQLKK